MGSEYDILTLRRQIDALRPNLTLTETEESWDRIATTVTSFSALCVETSSTHPSEIVSAMRTFYRPITNSMVSERTRLSGTAIDLVSTVARELGVSFEGLLPLFLPTLLNLCGRTNKVVFTRARACIVMIIESTQLSSVLPYFLQSLKEKSATLRLVAAEGTLTCLNCCNPPDLEKEARAKEVEAIIRSTAKDANPDVRKASRKIFEGYKELLPDRVASFTAPLTPTMRKYLDIKATTQVKSKPIARPNLGPAEVNFKPSRSTSSVRSASDSRQPTSHVRSASSSSVTTTRSTFIVKGKEPASHDMPPPQYVPVRPVQMTRQAVDSRPASTEPPSYQSTGAVRSVKKSSDNIRSTTTGPARMAIVPAASERAKRTMAESSTKGGASTTTGPRRVPLPEKPAEASSSTAATLSRADSKPATSTSTKSAVARKPVVPKGTTSTESFANNEAPSKSTIGSSVPAKVAPVTKKPVNTAAIAASKLVASKPLKIVKAHAVTQPTLSQIARGKPQTAQKRLSIGTSKPLWGRPASRKPNAGKLVLKRPVQAKDSKATTSKKLASTATSVVSSDDDDDDEPVTPTEIPLPPSPSPQGPTLEEAEHITEIVQDEEHEQPQAEETEEEVIEQETTLTPSQADTESTQADSTTSQVPSFNYFEAESSEPRTPPSTLPAEFLISSAATKTPISALLTSIEQGFMFTPSSPLSPPASYRTREPFLNDNLNIPFHFGRLDVEKGKVLCGTENQS